MLRKYKVALVFSILSSLPFGSAVAEGYLDKDFKSERMIQRKVGSQSDYFQYVFYYRKGFETFASNPDYFYLWNGEKQTLPEFMNLTGLMENNKATDKRAAVFMGAVTDGYWEDSPRERNSLRYMAKIYQKIEKPRREISIGFDLGAAEAFRFACINKMDAVVLSQGGIYIDEDCSPQNMEMIYSVNVKSPKFPVEHKQDFDFRGRHSGYETKEQLVSLLKCNKSPIISKSASGSELRYKCAHNNNLVVLEHDLDVHQWNGYVNTPEGFSNMQGESSPYPLLNWLKSELHVE
ncbi:hypothetical protein [Vibrio sp. D431a]|uniref:hypothetical protein n=1 Tax=Vibrio sp. D431a TaxID=2837388 RepID=UPI0025548E49|nr:hypothetical protein [Vibrio sp. D431a]MDK9790607.1 hypothetical protein [Vibrio sp. D431a]